MVSPCERAARAHHHWRCRILEQLAQCVIGGYKATEAHPVRHIAKVDDDTFLNLPVLQRDLDSLHCRKHLYYGIFAFAGYNSVTYTKCGFDYGNKGGRYEGMVVPSRQTVMVQRTLLSRGHQVR